MVEGTGMSGYDTSGRPEPNLDTDVSGESPEEIRQDIEQTRAQMTDTVDAIEAKLDPNRLKEEAKGAIRDATIGKAEAVVNDVENTAKDMMNSVEETGASLWDTIKSNPIPAALAAIGIGWLVVKARGGQSSQQRQFSGNWQGQGRYFSGGRNQNPYPYQTSGYGYGFGAGQFGTYTTPTYGGGFGQYGSSQQGQGQEQGQGVMDQAQQTASQLGDQASQMADQVQQQVSQWGDQAQQQVSQWSDQAQYQAQQLQSQFQQTMRQNPLAVGAIAFGLGMAAGLAVPETHEEDKLFGATSDKLTDRAEQMAGQAADKVEQKVESAMQGLGGATQSSSQSSQQQSSSASS